MRCTSPKCGKLPLNASITARVLGEFCADARFHKFAFCVRRLKTPQKLSVAHWSPKCLVLQRDSQNAGGNWLPPGLTLWPSYFGLLGQQLLRGSESLHSSSLLLHALVTRPWNCAHRAPMAPKLPPDHPYHPHTVTDLTSVLQVHLLH